MDVYFAKFKGQDGTAPPATSLRRSIHTLIISFMGMVTLSTIHYITLDENPSSVSSNPNTTIGAGIGTPSPAGYTREDLVMLIGSQAATAVLIFNAISSPLAQPRNVVGGNIIGSLVGVAVYKGFEGTALLWLAVPLAVSLTIFAMDMTRTVHPPAGVSLVHGHLRWEWYCAVCCQC